MAELGLRGRRIAVTRPVGLPSDCASPPGSSGAGALGERLEALGASVLVAPAIRREPPSSWEPLDRGVARLLEGGFDGVLFTSPAGVAPFWLRLSRAGGTIASLSSGLIGAVGGGTSSALARIGIRVDVRPVQEDGVSLARAVGEHLGDRIRGMRFLQPRAEEGRAELSSILRSLGAEVDVAAAYRTVRATAAELAPLVEELGSNRVDAIVFASPSAVEAVAAAATGVDVGGVRAVAIGRTTAAAIEKAWGIRPMVSARADDEALVDAVVNALVDGVG